MTMVVNGCLGGLVSVTAGADALAPGMAFFAALIGGALVVSSAEVLNRFRIDDAVGAVSVHGFCGAWGTLAIGLFYQGDMFNVERIMAQVIGIVAALVWALGASLIVFAGLNKVMKLRVSTKMEQRGLDISEHKEVGYSDFVITHIKADQ
jgi:Amt family ammonium transporter